MKHILIIHTGGTFGMIPTAPDNTLIPGKIEEDIDCYLPALNDLAEIDIKIPFNLDSSNIGPEQWVELYILIEKNYDLYDGFIIIYGTDTLVYTATAISYLLAKLSKPVVFTGSQRPLSAIRSDARSNLINAVELATKEIPTVGLILLYMNVAGKRWQREQFHWEI